MRAIPKEERMDTISFVFQNSRLLKGSILDNVRLGRAQATEAEVLAALKAAPVSYTHLESHGPPVG